MLEAIAKELKSTRIKSGLSMLKVANDNNFNIETLRRYETNSSGMSVERLENLLKYYKADVNIFFRNICEYMHKDIENLTQKEKDE